MSSRPNPPSASIGDTTGTPVVHAAPAAQTIIQVVDNVFTKFDANADASISLTELLSVFDPTGTRTDAAARAAALLAEVDSSGDKVLSQTEVTAAVTSLDTNLDGRIDRSDHAAGTDDEDKDLVEMLLHGRGPQGDRPAPTPLTTEAVVDRLLSKFDDNGDQSLTLTELLSGLNADDEHHVGLTTLVTQMVKDLDSNADSSLSTVELTAAVDALDVNQNGLVDFAEMGPVAPDSAAVDLVGLLMQHGHDLPGHAG